MACSIRTTIYSFILPVALLCLLWNGCAKPKLPPPSKLQLKLLDTNPLKGKIIVIDPGHGGPEHGAVGKNGLKESEVNLGVALYLWGLLQQAGATPILTRSADSSVIATVPFSLEADLRARAELSNTHNADLFVSIHHNSDISNPNRNEIQVYYKMSDSGPSRDIARSILHALKEQLHAAKGDIFAGNYRVLRNTHAPAILGESSFISNKNNEGMLSFQRTLQVEAEGYFAGILSYYQKGVPEISSIYPKDLTITSAQPEIGAHIKAGSLSRGIDPGSIIFKLDGERITSYLFREDRTLSFSPPKPLENGSHTVCLAVRNTAGNNSPETCASFAVSLPPAAIYIIPIFPVIPPDGVSSTALDVTLSDALGRPVMDGTKISLSATGGTLLEQFLFTRKGHARGILVAGEQAKTIKVSAEAETIRTQTSVTFTIPAESLLFATIRDQLGNPVEDAELIRNDHRVYSSDNKGRLYDRVLSEGKISYRIYKKGYIPSSFNVMLRKGTVVNENIILNQIDGGVFFNRRIMLDPEGSSKSPLPIICELQKRIEQAGGIVYLTWDSGVPPTLKDRVAMASRKKVDLYLTIEITGKQLSAGYYYKSVQGKNIAESICQSFDQDSSVKWKRCSPMVFDNFITVQTEMPAVWIKFPQKALQKNSLAASIIYQALRETFNKPP